MRVVFYVLLLACSSALAKVSDIRQMVQVSAETDMHTLVVLDIDNTILETSQTVGSPQWVEHLVGEFKRSGLSHGESVRRAIQLFEEVQQKTTVQPVEPATPSFIQGWQDSGVKVMALTARPSALAKRTQEQLHSIGVHLERRVPFRKDFVLDFKRADALYSGGVLFGTPYLDKGGVLAAFLARTNVKPKKVVFVDDKQKNIKSVEKAMDKVGVKFVGFRYGGADAKVRAFDPVLARKQLQYSQGFLTDDEVIALGQMVE